MKLNEKGFSLIELMIVVGIIGILSTLALPRFQQFQAKAKMGEAKNNLSHIYTLQHSYHVSNNQYVSFGRYGRQANGTLNCTAPVGAQQIGFQIAPCSGNAADPVPRYGYEAGAPNRSTFTATARSGTGDNNLVCPGSVEHNFVVNQVKEFTENPNSNALSSCF